MVALHSTAISLHLYTMMAVHSTAISLHLYTMMAVHSTAISLHLCTMVALHSTAISLHLYTVMALHCTTTIQLTQQTSNGTKTNYKQTPINLSAKQPHQFRTQVTILKTLTDG
jgi:hypothetical protein